MPHFADTTAHEAVAQELTRQWRETDPADAEAWLLQRAEWLARDNALASKGGPFGALVAEMETKTVLGAAANHATLHNDPTAHAEVLALRAAGMIDLSAATLLTSCECCPMCLAASHASGIRRIQYHATRQDAARAGFADAAQYALIAQPMTAQATCLSPADARHAEAHQRLGGQEAIVLVPGVEGFRRLGSADATSNGPTATPIIRALRQACAAWGHPRLPPGSRLIARHRPDPVSLLAADWANLGRSGDLDDEGKDASAILYLSPGKDDDAFWAALRDPEKVGMRMHHRPLPAQEAFAAWAAHAGRLDRY